MTGGASDLPELEVRQSISHDTWWVLLGLANGLVSQPPALTEALRSPYDDPETTRLALDAAGAAMSQEARFVVGGLADLIEQAAADRRGDHNRVRELGRELRARFSEDDQDRLRGLDAVVQGIARGKLPPDRYQEAHELLNEVLPVAHFMSLITKFRLRRRSLREWLAWRWGVWLPGGRA